MANSKSFNSVVAARTRAARFIAQTPELLAKWEELGGLRADLERIVAHGTEAESLNQQQSASSMNAELTTLRLRRAFEALTKEHSAILAVVMAMRPDFTRQPEVDLRLGRILANEGTLRRAADGDGTKRLRRSTSHEAVRAEIARDAKSLLDFTEVAQSLAKRRVPRERLEALLRDADALTETVADRLMSKGSRKGATALEWEAVGAQRLSWGSAYPMLRKLAAIDPRVADLLKAAKR